MLLPYETPVKLRDEAAKDQGARRKEDTNKENNAAVPWAQQTKKEIRKHDENRHRIEATIRVATI